MLEALGYGAPVLASNIPPNCEVLGVEGQYFSAGDVGDLTARLSALSKDTARLHEQAVSLQQHALATYDWDRVVQATLAVYESVQPKR